MTSNEIPTKYKHKSIHTMNPFIYTWWQLLSPHLNSFSAFVKDSLLWMTYLLMRKSLRWKLSSAQEEDCTFLWWYTIPAMPLPLSSWQHHLDIAHLISKGHKHFMLVVLSDMRQKHNAFPFIIYFFYHHLDERRAPQNNKENTMLFRRVLLASVRLSVFTFCWIGLVLLFWRKK